MFLRCIRGTLSDLKPNKIRRSKKKFFEKQRRCNSKLTLNINIASIHCIISSLAIYKRRALTRNVSMPAQII